MKYDKYLDTSGTLCPIPVIRAKRVLSQLESGQLLLIKATDPASEIDIPYMCYQMGFSLEKSVRTIEGYTFLVKK
ncbi:hypothetical protein F8A10_16930 [Paracoccus kondratievae]|uniref:sulfurtransferase TusA family protein n=1 Tax=Paracoccus kondratievae TaxID=135740 RepID=UPI0012664F85|nr:hypothetical protein F8A10_16930 [Paracoccus kondratievae]